MKICMNATTVTQKENYFSVATNCTEIRIFFLTDHIIRIRAGFDGDFAEESYSLVTTAWEDRMDTFLKDYRKRTAKGGCVVAVKQRLGLPVRFIGVGEGIDDLIPFTPEGYVEELLPRQWKH